MARASILAVELRDLHLIQSARLLAADSNNLLSVAWFSVSSLVLAPGRGAWGWGWAGAVVLWLAAARPPTPGERQRFLTASVLFLSCGPLLFRPGGLLDQRFDPFGALAVSAAACCLLDRRVRTAAWLSLAAVLAKGPALPVCAALWTIALVTGTVRAQDLGRSLRRSPAGWAALATLATLYGVLFLRNVVAYNLAEVPGSGEGVVWSFLRSAPRAMLASGSLYPTEITRRTPFVWLLVAGALASLIPAAGRERRLHDLTCGLTLGFATYLIFAATPPSAAVLIVWFAPAAFLLARAAADAIPEGGAGRVAALCAVVAAVQLARHTVGRGGVPEQAGPDLRALRAQAAALADELGSRDLAGRPVRLLLNFQYVPEPSVSFDYDAYRVLIFERLRRGSPRLEGWLLETWHRDGEVELGLLPRDELYLVLLSMDGAPWVHPGGRSTAAAAALVARLDPRCELPALPAFSRPELGRPRAYLTGTDLRACVPRRNWYR